jgi:poly(A) polymerase
MTPEIKFRFNHPLPPLAEPAVRVVQKLVDAGHQALLAGGCVRDLLLGREPVDYDVATDAPPERVCEIFPRTRQVGAQFGVVLVKSRRRWIEVATFRSDGPYLDGRHPASVRLTDVYHDALRRDFTVNGMFLDPLAMTVIDYVNGRADLGSRLICAIGDPAARFEEDYLRLLRAPRFAAKLDFAIEPETLAAIRRRAEQLTRVAAERVREELEKMFGGQAPLRAWRLLQECGLLPHLWPGASWPDELVRRVDTLLGRLPSDTTFELVLAVVLQDCDEQEIGRIARDLTLSNDQLDAVAWLVDHRAALDVPRAPSLADLKRMMAHPAFRSLVKWTRARYGDRPEAVDLTAQLDARIAAIPPRAVAPPPFVRGDDLMARNVRPGPVYSEVLDALYTRQLNEELLSRDEALEALERLLAERGDPEE